MRIPEIERIVDERLIRGADVEHHRHALFRGNAGQRSVEIEFSDWDPHPVGAQVPEAQDSLPVGDDDDPNVRVGPVREHGLDLPSILGRDVKTARLPKNVGELFARLADRWGVDQRHEFLHVVDERAVKQPLVAVVERTQ